MLKNPRQYRSWLRYTLKKHILPDLAMIPIASLTPGQIEALRDRKLAKGYKPATVNSMLKAICAAPAKSERVTQVV